METNRKNTAIGKTVRDEIRADAPILIFDSGVGGLTVLDAVRRLLPSAPIVFAADQAGLPYGTKSEAEITARVTGLLGRMSERFRPRLICIACNTASTIALSEIREVLETPIVGTVPAIKPAAAISKTGTIGLLGTQATVRQSYVDNLEREFARGKVLIRYAAPELVLAAEIKLRTGQADLAIIESAVATLRNHPQSDAMDTIVLACTHFPLLQEELSRFLGPDIALVDGSEGIARRIAQLLQGQTFTKTAEDLAVTTGPRDDFLELRNCLEARGISRLEHL